MKRHHRTFLDALTVCVALGLGLTRPGAVEAQDLLVGSNGTHSVLRYDGITGAFLGTFATGGLPETNCLAYGPDGNLYVSAFDHVQRYDGTTGALIDTFVPKGSGGLAQVVGLVFGPDGNLYLADYYDIKRYDGKTGAPLGTFASGGGLYDAQYIVFGPDGNLYVCSEGFNPILRYNGTTGAFMGAFVPSGSGGLDVAALAFGPDGNLYVTSYKNSSVLRYDGTTGAFIDAFVPGGRGGLDGAIGLTFGPDGNLYVTSRGNNSVLRYNGKTGAFLDAFVPGTGGLIDPFSPIFSPTSRNYITPDHGGSAGSVSVLIVHPQIQGGATVRLQANNQPNIIGSDPQVSAYGHTMLMRTTFDLRGAAPGPYSVVISQPDKTSLTLFNPFTVEEGGAPQIWVDVVGRSRVRRGNPSNRIVLYGNRGSVNLYDAVLTISFPQDREFSFESQRPNPDDLGLPWLPPIAYNSIPLGALVEDEVRVPSWIFSMAAGSRHVENVQVAVPAISPSIIDLIHVTLDLVAGSGYSQSGDATQIANSPVFRTLVDAAIQAANAQSDPDAIRTMQNRAEAFLRGWFDWAHDQFNHVPSMPGTRMEGFLGYVTYELATAILLAERALPAVLLGRQRVEDADKVDAVNSFDPNDLAGSQGFGDAHWLSGEEPLRYAVFFTNEETANAPAQTVVLTDQLDIASVDLSSVSLGPISFAGQTVTPVAGVSPVAGIRDYQADVDMRPVKNLIVRINASVDMLTGNLTWHFTSLDPATMQPPDDPLLGFLDPGQEGSVLFSVMSRSDVPTGTVVNNQATVVFDVNPPMDTPVWFNTLDNDKPTSKVANLAAGQSSTSFTVRWSGQDVGSGLRDYTIYVSDNGAPYTAWLTNTTDTSATFTGVAGHTYAFYSQARDNAYNIETSHATADATTTVLFGSVSAVVLDRNRQPLAGAEVHLFDLASKTFITPSAVSGADGTATITSVPPGKYHIGAYKSGCNMWIFSPNFQGWNVLGGGDPGPIEIVLDKTGTIPGGVQGFVRYDDATGAHPIGPGVHIDVYSGGHLFASGDSDANGHYQITGLPSISIDGVHHWWGWYTYIATWNGHQAAGVNFGVWAPLTIRMDIPFKL